MKYLKIIDNKKVSMSQEEWELYQSIVKSYSNGITKGDDMFSDLFETDERGIITLLKPPSTKFTSMEVLFFLMNLMTSQHIRVMHEEIEALVADARKQLKL